MELEEYLEEKMPEMKAFLEEMVNMDTNTYDKEDVDKLGKIIKEKFEEIGMEVKVHREKKFGNHLEVTPGKDADPEILIIAHLDTVYKKGAAEERPFEVIGEKGYGPGVSDEKSSHVAVLYALKALQEAGSDAYKNVHIIFNSDEEIGSPTSKPIIEEAAKNKQFSLVVESGRPDDTVVSERKGVGDFELEVEGVSGEAGTQQEKGKSAIEELSQKIVRLQELNDLEKGLSVNIGIVGGGVAGGIIAPEAEGKIDVRVADEQQEKEVIDEITEIAEENHITGTNTKLEGGMSRPPMVKTEETEKLLDIIRQAGEELGMSIKDESTGGGSDASFTASEGIPTIDGMGPLGEYSHNLTEEYVDLKTFPKRTALLARTIERLSVDN